MKHLKNILLLFIFTMVIFSCGGNNKEVVSSADTGSIALNVTYQGLEKNYNYSSNNVIAYSPSKKYAAPIGVAYMKAIVTCPGMDPIEKIFNALDGEGVITGIPVGEGRVISLVGLDDNQEEIYEGESIELNITKGQETPTSITVAPKPPAIEKINSGVSNQLNSVFSTSSDNYFAVGNNGKIFNLLNDRTTASEKNSSTSYQLNDVFFIKDIIGFAVGQNGAIIKTTDKGNSWSNKNISGQLTDFNSVCFLNEAIGFIVGNNGLILKTIDSGDNWTSDTVTNNDLTGIYFITANIGFIIGKNGTFLKTTNRGTSWSTITTGYNENFTDIKFITSSVGWLTGWNGTILKTTDGGSNWYKQTSGVPFKINAIAVINIYTAFVCGDYGTLLKTLDSGNSWTKLETNTYENLISISFENSKKGVVTGANGTVIKLKNRGTIPPEINQVQNQPINPNVAYTVNWSNITGATYYELEESNGELFTSSTKYTVTTNSKTFNSKFEGYYVYRVRGVNSAGYTGWSNLIKVVCGFSLTAPALSDPGPTDDDGSYLVNWNFIITSETSGIPLIYVLQEDDNYSFSSSKRVYSGSNNQVIIKGKGNDIYYYRVKVKSPVNESSWSSSQSIQVNLLTAPDAPFIYTLSSPDIDGSYTVSWQSASKATSYELQESTNSSFGDATTIYSGSELSYDISGKTNGTYYYRARGTNWAGNSGWSSTSINVSLIPVPNVPVLSNLSSPNYTGNYNVQWNSVTGVDNYELQEATSSSFSNPSTIYSGNNNSFNITNKTDGTYYYRIRATNVAGNSNWSSSENITIQIISVPNAPTLNSLTSPDYDGNFTITWSTVSGATNYELQEADNSSFSNVSTIYSGNSTSYSISNKNNGTYYYRVKASNIAGVSNYSYSKYLEVNLISPPSTPTLNDLTSPNYTGDYTISWSSISNADSYELQEATNSSFTDAAIIYSGNNTFHEIKSKTNGIYYYRIKAYNIVGNSSYSNAVNLKVELVNKPTVPYFSEWDDSDSDGTYRLFWTFINTTETIYFKIEESESSNFNDTNYYYVGSDNIFGTGSFLINKSTNGTYYYRIKAFNRAGSSDWNSIVTKNVNIKIETTFPNNVKVEWQKMFGGLDYGNASSIQQTSDGGYVVAGEGILKLDFQGNIEWSNADGASSIQQTSDGGYIVAGSHSTDIRGFDYYIIKLDINGNKQWQKKFGGGNDDRSSSIQQTKDGGYIVAGSSESTDISGVTNNGFYDYYIIKLDANGNKQWHKMFGGWTADNAHSIQQTSDGGYIVAGSSYSNISGVTNNGRNDYYIIKLDTNGNRQWQKMFGGSDFEYASSIQQTSDSGYIVAGSSGSTDISGVTNNGNSDYYIIKLDANGNRQWQEMYGGGNDDNAQSIQQTKDGGYIVAGSSGLTNSGSNDFYIIKLSQNYQLDSPVITKINSIDTDGNYVITWSSVDGAETYILQEKTDAETSQFQTVYEGTDNSYTFSNKDNDTYYYRVRAINSDSVSAWCAAKKINVKRTILKLLGTYEGSINNFQYKFNDIVVKDNIAYIARYGGFEVVNITNPEALTGGFDGFGEPGDANHIFIKDDFIFVAHQYGLKILHITESNDIEEIISKSTTYGTEKIFYYNNFVYTKSLPGGLDFIYEFDTAIIPYTLNTYSGGGSLNVGDVYFNDNLRYTIDDNFFKIGDFQNSISGYCSLSGDKIFATDTYGFVLDIFYSYSDVFDTKLYIVNVSDVENPTIIGEYHLTRDELHYADIYADSKYVYIAYSRGITIIDISNPVTPVLVTKYEFETAYSPKSIYVKGNYIYVTDMYEGLFIFSLE